MQKPFWLCATYLDSSVLLQPLSKEYPEYNGWIMVNREDLNRKVWNNYDQRKGQKVRICVFIYSFLILYLKVTKCEASFYF